MTTNKTAAELDIELNAAADLLQKVASENGIDLESLPEEEVAALLHEVMGQPKVAAEAAAAPQTEQPAAPSHAAVSFELVKRAAAENLDLTACTPEQYQQAYDIVAAEMADPAYGEKIAAAQQEFAHMDEMGRVAARGFYDELNKLAAEEEEKKEKGEGKKMPPFFAKDKKEDDGDHDKDDKKEASLRDRLVSLAKTASTSEPKAAFLKQAAAERAAQLLLSQGIDPATGEKLATDAEIDAAARALLAEKGYKL